MTRLARFLLLFALVPFLPPSTASAQHRVVRAVLFYSPACPHCHKVINQDLPPLFHAHGDAVEAFYIPPSTEEERFGPPVFGVFGEKLQILYLNTYTALGSSLYRTAVEQFEIARDKRRVPLMIVGETVLVGADKISELFPFMVAEGLAGDGIDWPEFPGLFETLAALTPVPAKEPASEKPSRSLSVVDKIMLDPLGNSLSIVVLIGMAFSVVAVGVRLRKRPTGRSDRRTFWAIPLLALVGIFVAGYMAYVDTTHTDAACGPVGDCNAVQQSEYATLFGVIPISVLGLVGYVAILSACLVVRLKRGRSSDLATAAIFGMTAIGVLFMIYLTFLEPFVIGATCIWCLSSATVITIQMWLSVNPAVEVLARLRKAAT